MATHPRRRQPRKVYRLTDDGAKELERRRGEWAQLQQAVNALLLRGLA
ncbi:hypothetical protein ACFP81_01755 [Deinococcus lacus]|uniref:PadR family transcriptional regulator n=1 Tax=Deinococcus lacus TaxID=392561 RepID=A0ABW1YA64_9DEIO